MKKLLLLLGIIGLVIIAVWWLRNRHKQAQAVKESISTAKVSSVSTVEPAAAEAVRSSLPLLSETIKQLQAADMGASTSELIARYYQSREQAKESRTDQRPSGDEQPLE